MCTHYASVKSRKRGKLPRIIMLRVIEAFSGIGSQAKALERIGADFEVLATIDWDINAIIAYDIIHNGPQDLTDYNLLSRGEILARLREYTLSSDGKNPLTFEQLRMISNEILKRTLAAIERTNNLVSITDVKAKDLPSKIDVLTYSFPCQDLSICGSWHGNKSGIKREANNRSGMLWEVERILKEYKELHKRPPKFLLMENVSNILSKEHKEDFQTWKDYLEEIGYINQVYTLEASNFGIPQRRHRTFMISVYANGNKVKRARVINYFKKNDLEKRSSEHPKQLDDLSLYLRTDYSVQQYREEADISNPNFTESRKRIYENNDIVFDGKCAVQDTIKTITTKQDRHPNSGLVLYPSHAQGKAPYRNITPRECFLLMGFDESDFQTLIDNEFLSKSKVFYSKEKLIKMAGNSIVVNVLEEVFRQIIEIKEKILD